MKRIVVAHGWDGNPGEAWFPWLKKELEAKSFQVIIPQLPNPGSPRINTWVPAFAKAVGKVDEDTYLVGHSMGCQTVARYIEGLSEGEKVGGAIFVAGFFKHLTEIDDDENSQETVKDWLTTKPDFTKIKEHLLKSTAIFSDNDKYVPLDNQDDYRDALGSKIVILENQGHFNNASNTKELPIVVEELLGMQ